MAKVVVYALLTTAFIIFLTFSPKKQEGHKRLGLNRRLGNKFPLPSFDPLVAKMDRLREEGGEDNQTNSSHVHSQNDHHYDQHHDDADDEEDDAHEFYGEDGKLNITLRLMILFPLVDRAPRDGVISLEELQSWIVGQAIDRLSYRTQKEMSARDKNADGSISFSEYLPQFSKEDIEKNAKEHGEAGWWMERFVNADADQNGILNFDEFNNFLHTEDSDNENIQIWVLREKMKVMDHENDGKLNFVEFLGAYDIYTHYVEFDNSGSKVPTAEEKFAELDVNNDRFLVPEELRPIYRYLNPGELTYARYYTNYLIQRADDDEDGKLTLDEMLNHEYVFYSTVYDDYNDDDDDFDSFHDEL